MKALKIIVAAAAIAGSVILPATSAVAQQQVHMDSQGYCIKPLGVTHDVSSGFNTMRWYNRCGFMIVIEWSRMDMQQGKIIESTTNVHKESEGSALIYSSEQLWWHERP